MTDLKNSNKYIRFILILLLFFLLLSLFFSNSIKNGNFLLPLDIFLEYDSVLKIDNYQAHNYLPTDIILQFLPYRAVNHFNGGITFWNPYSLGGLPFFEDIQSRSLEVSNLLANLLKIPLEYFFLFSTFILLIFAGVSMYYYLKELRLDNISTIAGAIVFTFSSPVVIWINYTLGTTFIWLPFLFLCVEKIFNNNKIFFPIFSFAVCFQLFAGHPQAALINIIFVSLYIIYKFIINKKINIKKVIFIFLFMSLGIGLSAVQTIPAFNFIKQSEVYQIGRGEIKKPFKVEAKSQLTSPRANFDTMFNRIKNQGALISNPNYFGNPVDRNYSYPEKPLYNNYFEITSYIGILSIFIAIMAIVFLTKKRKLYFWVSCLFLSFVLSLNLPFFNLLSYIPIINKVNLSRLTFVLIFCLSILAAYGINELNIKIKNKTKNKKIIYSVGVLLLLVVFFDLFSHLSFLSNKNNISINDFEKNEVIKFLSQTDYRFVGITGLQGGVHAPLIPNLSMLYQLNDIRGYFVMRPNRFFELSKRYLTRRGSYILADDIFNRNFLNLYSVKYIICEHDLCERYKDNYKIVKETEGIKILENDKALPRAFISYNYKQYSNVDEVFSVLENESTSIENEILVEGNFNSNSEIKNIDPVEIINSNTDKIKIVADAQDRGVLVLTDNYYKGWRVYVNGEHKEIVPVFGSLKGVIIERGINNVEFVYWPEFFTLSIIISILSFIVVWVIFICIKKNLWKTFILN